MGKIVVPANCEVCQKPAKYDEKTCTMNIRRCCDHKDSQFSCINCYVLGKGNHKDHNGKRPVG